MRYFVVVVVAAMAVVGAMGACADHPLHMGTFTQTVVDIPGSFSGEVSYNRETGEPEDIHEGPYQRATYKEKTVSFDTATIGWLSEAQTQDGVHLCAALSGQPSCCNADTYKNWMDLEYELIDESINTTIQYRADIGYAYDTMRRFSNGVTAVVKGLGEIMAEGLGDLLQGWAGKDDNGDWLIEPADWTGCIEGDTPGNCNTDAKSHWGTKQAGLNRPADVGTKDACEDKESDSDGDGSSYSNSAKDEKRMSSGGVTSDKADREPNDPDQKTCVDSKGNPPSDNKFGAFIAKMFDKLFSLLLSLVSFVNSLGDAFEMLLAGLMVGLDEVEECVNAVQMYHAGLLCAACDPDFPENGDFYNESNNHIFVDGATSSAIVDSCRAPIIDVPLYIVQEFFSTFSESLPTKADEEEEGKLPVIGMVNELVSFIADSFKAVTEKYSNVIGVWNANPPDDFEGKNMGLLETGKDFVEKYILYELEALKGWASPLVNLDMYETNGGVYAFTGYLYSIPYAWMKFYNKLAGFEINIMGKDYPLLGLLDVMFELDGTNKLDVSDVSSAVIIKEYLRKNHGINQPYFVTCEGDSFCSMKQNREDECQPSTDCPAVNALLTIGRNNENFNYDHTAKLIAARKKEMEEEALRDNTPKLTKLESLDSLKTSNMLDGNSLVLAEMNAVATTAQAQQRIRVLEGTNVTTSFRVEPGEGFPAMQKCYENQSCMAECGCENFDDIKQNTNPNARNSDETAAKRTVEDDGDWKEEIKKWVEELGMPVVIAAGSALFLCCCVLPIILCCKGCKKQPMYGAPPMMGPPGFGGPPPMSMGRPGPPMSMGRPGPPMSMGRPF